MFYIVFTKIFNIQYTSIQTVKTLIKVDTLLVEDTRSFDSFYKNIQELFHLKKEKSQTVIHFHKENEFEKLAYVLSLLHEGKSVALVSESGMPLISDPGSLLLKHVIKNKIPYTIITGPTAFVNAVVLSGHSTENVLFLGFLPKKKPQALQLFNRLKYDKNLSKKLTVVFYESPHRINETLKIIDKVFPDSEICICREMTKKFEEVIRGTAQELAIKTYKGEITVVMEINV